MLSWSINLFRIRGIQLALHFSFVLWLGYWGVEGWRDDGWSGMFWSVATLLAFFTCVVLHELGHSFTGMRFGLRVRRILLMPIGGMAEFDAIPRQPRQELLMTVAGPAVNFVLAALLWYPVSLLSARTSWNPGDPPASLADLGQALFSFNLMMGLFNLVPVFPMDGGRILRALLATRLSYLRATYWAATIGKVLAGAAIATALWFAQTVPPSQAVSLYVLAALFTFIFVAGSAEYRNIRRQEEVEAHWKRMTDAVARLNDLRTSGEPPLL